ncbi:MAG: 6-phosphogluconolactonase [Pyrinomonadaceae bacterium]|nr:6-phosphogluconolactonase [Pyrinomonadaceae bacterium]
MSALSEIEVIIREDKDALAIAAAARFVVAAEEATINRGSFRIALAGGSTPRTLYELLAGDEWRERVAWNKTHVFWGDERHVPPDHADSNYRMAQEALLARVPVPSENIHRIKAEQTDAPGVASEYEETLRESFQLEAAELPCFDLVLLGMGADGHTASLFPNTDALQASENRLAVAVWVEQFAQHRITLTLQVLSNARCVMFLVAGEDKAETLRTVLDETQDRRLPAGLVRPTAGKLVWLVDKAAASLLQQN